MLSRILFTAFLISVSGTVSAADNGFYIGASVLDANPDIDWPHSTLGEEKQDTGFKAIAGIRPLDWLAIEGNYLDLGKTSTALSVACPAIVGYPCPVEASMDVKAFSIAGLAFRSFGPLDAFIRIGASRWEADAATLYQDGISPFRATVKDDGIDLTYGAGLQVRLLSFAVRAEYERLKFSEDSAGMLSIGLTYTFL